jgi:O-acetyl-ADP-ribose deacetylase (regulator of RNase III)
MHFLFVDKNPKMVSAWKEIFGEEEQVKILEGDLTSVSCDAIVSPANSFGFMDGGVDYAISMRLGWELQDILQEKIKNLPEGELLIGKALILKTGDELIPYLVSAPTMRVPMTFNISSSINAYLAMKAVLIETKKHPEIEYVAVPGFCTGVGSMDTLIAAKQMYQAYKEIIKGAKMDFKNFGEAQKYHWNINQTGMIFE